MPATVEASPHIAGVYLVRMQTFADGRGYFYESFRRSWVPGSREMVQGNCSFSRAGVLRGMHYHLKQADLWSVPFGRARAALYDFRPSSPTFGGRHVLDLGRDEGIALYIPRGVAHGFYAVEDTMMTYLVDEYYDGQDELGIRWDDPAMALEWALPGAPVLSDRDAGNPRIEQIPADRRPR